jgi:hypothetical protein
MAEESRNEIVGISKSLRDDKPMLEFELCAFTYPGKDGACTRQPNKDCNVTISADLQQIRFIYMQQCTLRIVDYALVQVLDVLVTKKVKNVTPASEIETLIESIPVTQSIDGNDPFWQKFDLKQNPFVPALDIRIKSPFVIVPDL